MKSIKLILVSFCLVFLIACQSSKSNDLPIKQNEIDDNASIISVEENETYHEYFQKMSADLSSTIRDLSDHDVIEVYVFLKQIDYDEVSRRLLILGIDESIYRDEVLFLEYMYQLYGNDSEIIETERERYQTLRLQLIKQITMEVNQDFIDVYNIDSNEILYLSTYTTTLIIKISVGELKLIALNDNVVSLSRYIEMVLTND